MPVIRTVPQRAIHEYEKPPRPSVLTFSRGILQATPLFVAPPDLVAEFLGDHFVADMEVVQAYLHLGADGERAIIEAVARDAKRSPVVIKHAFGRREDGVAIAIFVCTPDVYFIAIVCHPFFVFGQREVALFEPPQFVGFGGQPRRFQQFAVFGRFRTYDPLRYKRLIHDLERIWVLVSPGGLAHFDESIRACVLDPRLLLNEANGTERIASSIVREATHARLRRRGIGYDRKEVRARVEMACMRRERAFGGKLPDSEQSLSCIDRKIEFYANPERWTDEVLRVRHEKETAEALEYIGFPRWLARLAGPVRSLRSRRKQSAGGSVNC
jgi:hypothetical protein